MRRLIAIAAVLVSTAGTATAQLPGQPPVFVPNYFNREYQPLSPYLRLFSPSPAVNYYYDVRPALDFGGGPGRVGVPQVPTTGMRQTFFPVVDTLSELGQEDGQTGQMTPTGHPIGFQNHLGYFPGLARPQGGLGGGPPAATLGPPLR